MLNFQVFAFWVGIKLENTRRMGYFQIEDLYKFLHILLFFGLKNERILDIIDDTFNWNFVGWKSKYQQFRIYVIWNPKRFNPVQSNIAKLPTLV